jgi:hypothetical protein
MNNFCLSQLVYDGNFNFVNDIESAGIFLNVEPKQEKKEKRSQCAQRLPSVRTWYLRSMHGTKLKTRHNWFLGATDRPNVLIFIQSEG